ncbi:hypothetical protein Bca4012_038981 [Brassica carinata]
MSKIQYYPNLVFSFVLSFRDPFSSEPPSRFARRDPSISDLFSPRRQSGQDVRTQNASETLIEHLRSENQDLKATLDTLRDEITEIWDKELLESQKCLVEEEQKNKALSEQVEKLKELISEGVPQNNKDQSGRK